MTEARSVQVVGERYELVREIGRGGSATVWLARDRVTGEDVAVKVLHEQLGIAMGPERFRREIEITRQLDHPNIVKVLDSGRWGDSLFFVMPFIDGVTLRGRMQATKGRMLPVEEVARIGCAVCEALEYAHTRGIVHRDVKPENILLAGDRVLLSDFGIARGLDSSVWPRLSTYGIVLGTATYMSPEQASGEPELDGSSDIYSLGVVLYEMLAGVPPFVGPNPQSILHMRMVSEPRALSAFGRPLPTALVSAVMRGLSRQAADRWLSADAFRSTIAAGLDANDLAATIPIPAPVHPLQRYLGRHRAVAIASLAIVAFVGAALVSASRLASDPLTTVPGRIALQAFFPAATALPSDTARAARLLLRAGIEQALSSWVGIDVVTLTNRTATQAEALTLSRQRGAALLVSGALVSEGAPARLVLRMFDVADGSLRATSSTTLPQGDTVSAVTLRNAVAGLLTQPRVRSLLPDDVLGTTSFSALAAYQRSRVHLAQWKRDSALADLAIAAQYDPHFASANLWYAQLQVWNDPGAGVPAHALPAVLRAIADSGSLSPDSRMQALAMRALIASDYAEACKQYRRLIRKDSTTFVGWLGLGDCIRLDSVVVSQDGSTSRWKFRSNWNEGKQAYRRALENTPHPGAAPLLGRAILIGSVRPSLPRRGRSLPPDDRRFVAYPSIAGDTLAYAPLLAERVANADSLSVPASFAKALERERRWRTTLAESWIALNSNLAESRAALSEALELEGTLESADSSTPTAASALTSAIALATDPSLRTDLAISAVRLYIKQQDWRRARVAADSLLTVTQNPRPSTALRLSGLSALIGNVASTSALLRTAWLDPQTQLAEFGMRLPSDLVAPLAELTARIDVGACRLATDSLLVIVDRLIALNYESARQGDVRHILTDALRHRATPCTRGRYLQNLAPSGYAGYRMQELYTIGDFGGARRAYDRLRAARVHGRMVDVTPDAIYHEAWLLAAIGDTATAEVHLDDALSSIRIAPPELLADATRAGSLASLLVLRSDIARLRRDKATHERWAEAVRILRY